MEKNVDLHISSVGDPSIHQMNLLAMFYKAVYQNKVGLAQVLNVKTGEQELVLAGLEGEGTDMTYYPIAKVLDEAEAGSYVLLEASEEVVNEDVNE